MAPLTAASALALYAAPAAAGELDVQPTEHDAGEVRVDDEEDFEDTILENTGEERLTVTEIERQGEDCEGSFEYEHENTPFDLDPGGEASTEAVTGSVQPDERGPLSCDLEIEFEVDGGNGQPEQDEERVEFDAAGVAPAISLSEEELVFPDTGVGRTSDAETFAIENDDDEFSDDLTVSIEVEGPDADAFDAEIQGCEDDGCTIRPGGAEDVSVTFTPDRSGNHEAEVVVEHDAPDEGDLAVDLQGEGLELLAEAPGDVDFGQVRIDEDPESDTFEVANEGDGAFEVEDADLDNQDDFSLVSTSEELPHELAPGDALVFEVEAHPGGLGARTGELSIFTDIPGEPVIDVELKAEGISPDLVLSRGQIDFGSHDVADDPIVESFTVGNPDEANADLEVQDAAIVGGDADVYAIVDDGGLAVTLEPDEEVEIEVAYDPVTASADDSDAAVLIGTDFENAEVDLIGNGIDRAIEVEPATVSFPETERNPVAPPTEVVTIRNEGDAPLSLDGGTLLGSAPEAFHVDEEVLQTELGAGEEQDVSISFVPHVASTAPLEASLMLHSDDRSHPVFEIELSGRVVLPDLVITPGELDLGRTGVDVPIARESAFAIENRDAEEALVVEAVELGGEDAEAFSLSGWDGGPEELEPGGERELGAEFEAGSEGVYEARIELYVEGDPESIAVSQLRGEATPFQARGGGCSAAAGTGAAPTALALAMAAAGAMGWRRLRSRAPHPAPRESSA